MMDLNISGMLKNYICHTKNITDDGLKCVPNLIFVKFV